MIKENEDQTFLIDRDEHIKIKAMGEDNNAMVKVSIEKDHRNQIYRMIMGDLGIEVIE